MPDAAPVMAATLPFKRSVMANTPKIRSGAAVADTRATGERIDNDGDRQNRAGDHVAQGRAQVEKGKAVRNRLDDDDAKQRGIGTPAAAEKAGAADDGRSNRVEVHVAGASLLAGRG